MLKLIFYLLYRTSGWFRRVQPRQRKLGLESGLWWFCLQKSRRAATGTADDYLKPRRGGSRGGPRPTIRCFSVRWHLGCLEQSRSCWFYYQTDFFGTRTGDHLRGANDAMLGLGFNNGWFRVTKKNRLGQKSSIYPKLHILKVSFLAKFTFSKSYF